MSRTNLPSIAGLLALLGATSAFAQPTVIYREIFSRPSTASNGVMNDAGWLLYTGTGATNGTNSTQIIGGNIDTPDDSVANALNSNPVSINQDNDAALFGSNLGTNRFLAFTSEYPINRSLYSVDTLSVSAYARNNASTGPISFAVQIGGAWYVSDTVLTTNVQTVNSPATLSINFGTSTWSTLNFTPGSTLSVAGTALLPSSGDITAFGFYGRGVSSYSDSRWDNFVVTATAVPESASLGTLAGALTLGFVATRRRRRQRPA